MRAVLRTSLEELMAACSGRVEQPKDMRRTLDEVSTTATPRDGLAKIIMMPFMRERWTAAPKGCAA
ncbi:hypothetical protein GCM10023196_107740 [Actinoallomurus vinaceus]|uniref:Uncharacterized protein n=1 Tax=Actinoallomurus vinaceus TaxID=1080074 RepID=A0ABP8UY07_9ACTN